MKKNGFTLAEVLITLAIIGVVASMTLPTLMTNTGEQQYKTGLKKGISTLTQAAKLNQANNGWDFGTATAKSELKSGKYPDFSAGKLITDNMAIKSGATAKTAGVANSAYVAIGLADGSSVLLDKTNAVSTSANSSTGYNIVFDVNGNKGPNSVSNCNGKKLAGPDADVTETEPKVDRDGNPVLDRNGRQTTQTTTSCTDQMKRVLSDQFVLNVYGTTVTPAGPAGKYAFEN